MTMLPSTFIELSSHTIIASKCWIKVPLSMPATIT
jgi:hypothetical protein